MSTDVRIVICVFAPVA